MIFPKPVKSNGIEIRTLNYIEEWPPELIAYLELLPYHFSHSSSPITTAYMQLFELTDAVDSTALWLACRQTILDKTYRNYDVDTCTATLPYLLRHNFSIYATSSYTVCLAVCLLSYIEMMTIYSYSVS